MDSVVETLLPIFRIIGAFIVTLFSIYKVSRWKVSTKLQDVKLIDAVLSNTKKEAVAIARLKKYLGFSIPDQFAKALLHSTQFIELTTSLTKANSYVYYNISEDEIKKNTKISLRRWNYLTGYVLGALPIVGFVSLHNTIDIQIWVTLGFISVVSGILAYFCIDEANKRTHAKGLVGKHVRFPDGSRNIKTQGKKAVKKTVNYKWYNEHRQSFEESQHSQTSELDKSILTLSGGAFGLSFAFIKQFINTLTSNKYLVIISWTLFTVSILSTLISFSLSRKSYDDMIKQLDASYDRDEYLDIGSPFSSAVGIANIISISAFILASLLLIIFVGTNF